MSDKLKGRNYVLMIDKSGSMGTDDCPGGKTRWAYAEEQTSALARECQKNDPDGIDIQVFAGNNKMYENVTAEKVKQIFIENQPGGGTNTAEALQVIFDRFNAAKAKGDATPLTIVCVTDGEPADPKAVAKCIIAQANKLEKDEELGITFIQIGKDAGARKFLKSLDDDLQSQGAKFDIVDTKNEEEMEELSIIGILEAAVED